MRSAQVSDDCSLAELGDGSHDVIVFAQSIAESPGVTAMLLSHAIALFALAQDRPVEALESQIEYLQKCRAVMLERLTS